MNGSAPTGERIHRAFIASRLHRRRAALMPFFMGGFPSLKTSREIGEAYADGGADVVELGVPCRDPVFDGPVIRAAGTAALRGGTTIEDVLVVARAISTRVPVVIMGYAHLVLDGRAPAFVDALGQAGVSGLLVPDLTREQMPPVLAACDAAGIALVPLIAPAASDEHVAGLAARERGFVYTVSAHGRTGERPALRPDVASLVQRVKANSTLPVALGFGIS
ncbi:MAG TPA: tryptophan synthase subunit alpha, partial [Solirubrobacteraceae bacterium]|nr:tryptophan synthase subunit alpha [Solirubrobacteraceae bacterium]